MSQRDSYIYVSIIAFALGILVSSFLAIAPLVGVFLFLLAGAIAAGEKVWRGEVAKEVWFVCFALAFFSLGVLRYDIKDFHEDSVPTSTGVVADEPEHRDTDTRFVLQTQGGKVLVSTDMYSPVEYGDEVQVAGKLKQPGVIVDDLGREFDYAAYLAREDIYYTESFARVEILSHGHGNEFKALLLSVKHRFIGKIKSVLPEPEASLLAGLIVAGKEALPKSVLQDFINAGTVHIVVLSGYNITIVAEFLRMLLSYFSLRVASLGSVFGILLFVLMAGATPSIIRAAIMALIAVGGKLLHRRYNVTRALVAAVFVMLILNPKILVFDPSFQLSFLATIGMIYGTPLVERYLSKVPERFGFRGLLAVTIATQLFVLPYLLYSMGQASVVSLVTNLLILPLVPPTMLVGFAATLSAFALGPVSLIGTYPTHLALTWILAVAHFFGDLPFAAIKISHFPLWLTLGIYGLFALGYLLLHNKSAGLQVPEIFVKAFGLRQ